MSPYSISMNLLQKKCIPCEGGIPPLTSEQIAALLPQTPGWLVVDNKKIQRVFVLKDFRDAMKFVNNVAEIANTEDHHPDITINYKKVTLELWTHAIGGLSENDFIVAAKINALPTKF